MRVTVIGAGNSGLAMSAHLSYHDVKVSLWNRSEDTISLLKKTHTINVSGIINGPVEIDKVTNDIEEALEGSELVLVTTPASSHSFLGKLLARNMKRSIPVILNPGRTFGALNFYESFVGTDHMVEPIVAETQTIIYTCRKESGDSVTIYSMKNDVEVASLEKGHAQFFIDLLPECIKEYFIPADSFLKTSLGNVGLVLHCMPFMLNTGWTECKTTEYKYYYDGITPTISNFIQHIDDERLNVGKALGIDLESTAEWMRRVYCIEGDTLYDCIHNNAAYNKIDAPRSIKHRYIYEDVPTGLAPVEKIGKELNISTKYISLAIDLANALVGEDFRENVKWISYDTIKQFI